MPKLVQITDLHLHAEPHAELRGADVDAGLDAVLAHIRAHHWPLDGLLATGDLIQDDPAAYPRLRQRLTAPGVPVYCLPGNHDRREAMAEALAECPVQWRRQLRLDGWQVLLLDSV
ncbi:MAG: metallophosphoesterase, partial [Candidatus Competibacterales bacterium]|nr:metallophosphoesterase [Candidatus Competibacterales bacterium]